MSAMNASRLMGARAGLVARSWPMVLERSALIERPHSEPAPCAG